MALFLRCAWFSNCDIDSTLEERRDMQAEAAGFKHAWFYDSHILWGRKSTPY